MFTGIIERVSELKAFSNTQLGRRFTIDLGHLASDASLGDSVAVNGVCLTIATLNGTIAEFDVMAETLKASTLGEMKVSDKLNLERAMAANGRFGGHFVQGHVDGTGRISKIVREAGQVLIYIEAPEELTREIIRKGSIAIDGISLTVADIVKNVFYVSLIPTTLKDTNLEYRKSGDKVNLEADIVAKMINAKLDRMTGVAGLDENKLRLMGY